MAILHRAALAAALALAGHALPATAQTANDVNRLNAAIQVCNSMPAGTPECAKLRGQLGGGGLGLGLGGGTVGKAAGMASLLGGVMGGGATAAPAPVQNVGIDLNKAITNCVARAAGDQVQIQRCLAIANGGAPARP